MEIDRVIRVICVRAAEFATDMPKAVLFDLYETLVTESRTRPAGVSSLAPELGCDRGAFRERWRSLRPAVMTGQLSFPQALADVTTSLGRPADGATLRRLSAERARIKAVALQEIEPQVFATLRRLRGLNVAIGVISNCCAEDVAAWARCSLAPYADCALFSFDVRLAKPDPEIYFEAMRRLKIDAANAWFVGDGVDECVGAERAGLRAFRALWFLERWPHFQEPDANESTVSSLRRIEDIVDIVGR